MRFECLQQEATTDITVTLSLLAGGYSRLRRPQFIVPPPLFVLAMFVRQRLPAGRALRQTIRAAQRLQRRPRVVHLHRCRGPLLPAPVAAFATQRSMLCALVFAQIKSFRRGFRVHRVWVNILRERRFYSHDARRI